MRPRGGGGGGGGARAARDEARAEGAPVRLGGGRGGGRSITARGGEAGCPAGVPSAGGKGRGGGRADAGSVLRPVVPQGGGGLRPASKGGAANAGVPTMVATGGDGRQAVKEKVQQRTRPGVEEGGSGTRGAGDDDSKGQLQRSSTGRGYANAALQKTSSQWRPEHQTGRRREHPSASSGTAATKWSGAGGHGASWAVRCGVLGLDPRVARAAS